MLLIDIFEKNKYLPGQYFTKQDLESLTDPEQDPPYFSTWVFDLVFDCVPPLPHDLEHDEYPDQLDHLQFTKSKKIIFVKFPNYLHVNISLPVNTV